MFNNTLHMISFAAIYFILGYIVFKVWDLIGEVRVCIFAYRLGKIENRVGDFYENRLTENDMYRLTNEDSYEYINGTREHWEEIIKLLDEQNVFYKICNRRIVFRTNDIAYEIGITYYGYIVYSNEIGKIPDCEKDEYEAVGSPRIKKYLNSILN